MIVDEVTRFQLQQEAVHHCLQVWPCFEEYRWSRNQACLAPANRYLGDLAKSNRLMHEIVMKMLSLRTGVDWAAIRDSLP